MAKLVVALLSIWLMAFTCSTGHVHGVGCFNFGRNSRRAIEEIMGKKPESRNEDEWKILLKAADKALRDASIMDIKSVLDVFRYRSNPRSNFCTVYARSLFEFTNISEDKCDDVNLPWEAALLLVTDNEHEFPVLYKHVKDSFDHYMDVCNLKDRYRDFVRWQSSKNIGNSDDVNKQPTFSDRVFGEISGPARYQIIKDSLTAIRLMIAPNSNSELRCNDEEFTAKLVEGLLIRHSRWARNYVMYVLDKSRKICGHEDSLILAAYKTLNKNPSSMGPLTWRITT